jgi:benzoyl-CoA reductase/2-hydroxyglutaryl-CoA dehydratase subunit BcrC/BadD/HgdB
MVYRNVKPLEILLESMTSMSKLIEASIPGNELRVLQTFLKCGESVITENIDRAQSGTPLLGHHFAFPSEIFYCFDIVPLCFEHLTYLKSAIISEGAELDYELADQYGHPYHTCSSQKGILGMILKENFMDIDVISIPTAPCDSTIASYQAISETKNIPTTIADMPYWHDERGYSYYTDELKRMIEKIGKIINQEPDYERLRKAIGYSTDAIKYLGEINDLKAAKPCPIESMFNPIASCAQNFFAGRPEKAQFYREIAELAKMRVKNNQGSHDVDNQIRAYWPYMSIFFDIPFCDWMDRELKMTAISDAFNYFFFDPVKDLENASPDEMIAGIAKQSMEYPMVRQSDTFADVFIEDSVFLAKKFEADCAIFTSHIGCKQSSSLAQIIREAIKEELGIPTLIIEVDIGDNRMNPIENIKKKIEEFSQIIRS